MCQCQAVHLHIANRRPTLTGAPLLGDAKFVPEEGDEVVSTFTLIRVNF